MLCSKIDSIVYIEHRESCFGIWAQYMLDKAFVGYVDLDFDGGFDKYQSNVGYVFTFARAWWVEILTYYNLHFLYLPLRQSLW